MKIFNKEIDPYEVFFGTGFFVVMSLLLAVISVEIGTDPNGVYIYPVACLFAVAIMGNAGSNSITAKETFWGWILVTVGSVVWAYFGRFLIWSFT